MVTEASCSGFFTEGKPLLRIRIGRVVAGAVALASAAVMTTTGNASAAPVEQSWSTKGSVAYDHVWQRDGVVVSVAEHGDIVRLKDTKANGHAAYVIVQAGDKGYTLRAGKYGDIAFARASWGGNYNLPENVSVRLTIWGDGVKPHYPNKSFVNDH
ncbi:hypothetical protein [Actinomadura sp. NPDC049753]|uniref:hypothetical protein n=1 Tax=Actinomadura sp. NPDC049753 TaxID=3154739 RepID=UPI003428146D